MNRIRAKLLITQDQLQDYQLNSAKQFQRKPAIRFSEDKHFESVHKICCQLQKLMSDFESNLLQKNIQELTEIRDRKVNIQISSLLKEPSNNQNKQIERWLTKLCCETFSIAFQQYSNSSMNFNQAKIFCSETILRNIALLSKVKPLKPDTFELMDKHLKNGVLRYMMTKYPLSDSTNINKKLNSLIKQTDNYQKTEYDFFSNSNLVFELRDSGNYNDLIMKVINTKLKQIQDVEPQDNLNQYGWSNYKKFESYFTTLFEKVQDQEWMNKKEGEFQLLSTFIKSEPFTRKRFSGDLLELTEGVSNFVLYEEEKKKLSKKERYQLEEKERQEKLEKKKYREKVRQYTHFLVGRKINENVPSYTQKQIDSLHLVIKDSSILRILTKWCEELWNKFQTKDYFMTNHEEGLKVQRGGNVNTLSIQLKQSLSKLIQDEKKKIEAFMEEIKKNNYQMQESLLTKELQNEDECTFMNPLEKACGVFSLKVVNNLHNYIITYLNRLIHGLLTVSDNWFTLNRNVLKAQIWPSPPNLLTLKIGDLMRCKCESKQNQIINLYRHIVKQSRQNPEQLKIIRVKNRLKQSTNDILMNILFNQKFVCEIQLSIQSTKSHFIEYSNQFCHYLYELQRSVFGPITEICSIWSSLDQRKNIYQEFLNYSYNQHCEGHSCEEKKLAYFKPFERPFICSLCKVAYSHNYYIQKHVKCQNCNYWRCAKCQIDLLPSQKILENIIGDSQIIKNCKKIDKIESKAVSCLPEYGFCIFQCSKIPKVEYFNLINIKNKTYLFGQREGKIYEIAEIYKPKKYSEFINNYLIFSLPAELGRKCLEIDRAKANHEYLLIKYRNQIFQKEKQSFLLQEEGLTDQICELIFGEQAKEKQNIKYLDLEENNLTSVKIIGQEFPNLKVLQLSSNQIQDYTGIEDLQQLEQLNISNYPLPNSALPEQIHKLSKLSFLNVQNADLEKFPESLETLTQMKKIEMGSNKIKFLPESITSFTKLEYLSAFSNKLQELTPEIGTLRQLKTLILSDNYLQTVPETISSLQNLMKLDLQSNHLTQISFSFCNLYHLQQLDISNNKLEKISEDIGMLTQLKTLTLSNNKLKKIPEKIRWENLTVIDLKHNEIENLSQSFYQCESLVKIQLSHNKIKEIKENISNLKLTQSLNLSNNQLQDCPRGISNLQNLIFLSLSSNKLTTLLEDLGNLNKLQFLYTSCNRIIAIPLSIRRCISLKQLYLNDNSITCIPDQLSNLQNLEQSHLDISENPIVKILCTDYILKKGDYMTKQLVMKILHMSCENEEDTLPQDLQRIKEASRKKSLRRRGEMGIIPLPERQSLSNPK